MGLQGTRITNEMKIGDWRVRVFADVNSVASFSVDSLGDATIEAKRIKQDRQSRGLPTTKATASQITGRSKRGYITQGAVLLEID